MSLKVSRRNFMKLSAAAALAVAGSSLLTGCSDPNKPTRNGDGTLTILSAETTVTRDTNNSYTFKVKIKNGRTNDLNISNKSFRIGKLEGDKTTAYSEAEMANEIDGWAIPKGQTFETTVTAKGNPNLGTNVVLQFRPDDAYDEMYASWIYGKTEK